LFRLASYGTLAPGRKHHDQLAGLTGTWSRGRVRGRLIEIRYGASLVYPGLILDRAAGPVEVHLLEAPELPQHWARLDAFEGACYRRGVVEVETDDALVWASIYEVAPE
jgi:gamma-glutamylcyclotransferase (GGCT)/AIG2-like uncharacterized protein YtfP